MRVRSHTRRTKSGKRVSVKAYTRATRGGSRSITFSSSPNRAAGKLDRHAKYRADVRDTFSRMSDQALAFQDMRVKGGIDREELDREIIRRRFKIDVGPKL